MRAAVDARAEHLRRLRIPEHTTVGSAHDHAVFNNLQRVDGGMCDHGTVSIEVALQRVDSVGDELGRHQRARTVMRDHVLVLVRHVLDA